MANYQSDILANSLEIPTELVFICMWLGMSLSGRMLA
jgi:hypothetical protein